MPSNLLQISTHSSWKATRLELRLQNQLERHFKVNPILRFYVLFHLDIYINCYNLWVMRWIVILVLFKSINNYCRLCCLTLNGCWYSSFYYMYWSLVVFIYLVLFFVVCIFAASELYGATFSLGDWKRKFLMHWYILCISNRVVNCLMFISVSVIIFIS